MDFLTLTGYVVLFLSTVPVGQCQDPEFIEAPVNTAAHIGDTARLNCSVDWSTEKFVEWTYQNTRIYDSVSDVIKDPSKYDVTRDGIGQFDLHVKNLQDDSMGSFVCGMPIDDELRRAELVGLGHMVCPDDVEAVDAGDVIILHCEVQYYGYKAPTLTWTREDMVPLEGVVTIEQNMVALDVNVTVTPDDDGRVFTCHLSFQAGESDVSDPPQFTDMCHTQVHVNTLPSTSALPSTSTTPRPSVNGTLPRHVVRVNGTAFTADGEALTPQCAVVHLTSLNQKAQDMGLRVNAVIGDSICMTAAADILVVSSAATMFLENEKTFLEIDHTLRVLGHHAVDDVETCAEEVGDFLNELSNWQQPIFPPVPGCSRLDIIPDYFNTSGTFWKCASQLDEDPDEPALINTLSYSSIVSEVLRTSDGENLSALCTREYSDEADKKTNEMMTEISNVLSTSECRETMTLATYSYGFIAFQDKAFFQATFFYTPSPQDSFAEFLACMEEVHDFCLLHENWSPGSQPGDPFLPVPPGCPALEHDTNTLDDDGHRWLCV